MKQLSQAFLLTALSGALLGASVPAHAQTVSRFSSVEFKDINLNDALEIIFKAANNPAHNIDPQAQLVNIGSLTLQNVAWDSALRTVANQNGYKVSRGTDGIYLVEPRVVAQKGTAGGTPFGAPLGGPVTGGNIPSNPFGAPGGVGFNNESFEGADPTISTQINAQTPPRFGGSTDTAAGGEVKKTQIVIVRHLYAGGIAQLFGGTVLSTEMFVSPLSGNGGGGGRGGNGNGGRSGVGGSGGRGGVNIGGSIGGNGLSGVGNNGSGNNGIGNNGNGNNGIGNNGGRSFGF